MNKNVRLALLNAAIDEIELLQKRIGKVEKYLNYLKERNEEISNWEIRKTVITALEKALE